ncbi:FkbM family methyltransferase [Sphingorhabdus sp. Alg231-15]|uniref:FkbM family methyltransferase n=1 Tax=Sphingorhabdus sp. Alg231-15 TaxID=1922222 RepID=UPI000D54F319
MTKFTSEMSAAVDMARSVGFKKTMTRLRNYAGARSYERERSKRFERLALDGKVVRSVLGSKMELDSNKSGLDRDILLDGIREPIATGHILSILQEDDIVLEVGANIGYYALIEARICDKIYAVEPHPENFERLKRNIALNDFDNVVVQQGAFGASDGKIPLYVSDLSNWHSCRDAPKSETDFIDVDCFTIDSFAKANEAPTFIKMDVEGYELEVLRGAEETLKTVKHLFLELHGTILTRAEMTEILDRIEAAGLKPSLIVQYDRPGLARTYGIEQLDAIRNGDRGTFELFFCR